MDLRREVEYSREFTGTYRVQGSCGRLVLAPEDTIEAWLEDNAMGLVRWDLSKHAHLIFDNGVVCSVYPSSSELKTGLSGPQDGKQYDYIRRVQVRVAPQKARIPKMLQKAFEERGLEEKK